MFSWEAACRCDSAADTRGSESTFPAGLADEKQGGGRGGEREEVKEGKRRSNCSPFESLD